MRFHRRAESEHNVTDALEERLQQDRLDDLASWLVEKYGTPPAECMDWAERVWRSFDEE